MSELGDFLPDAGAAGVYRVAVTVPFDELEAAANRSGWRLYVLDTSGVADKARFLEEAAGTFAFPAHFGRNWDAFADCLADVHADPGVIVLWEGWHSFAAADEKSFTVALEIVEERAATGEGRFVVLMPARSDG